jgi:transposase-like protein
LIFFLLPLRQKSNDYMVKIDDYFCPNEDCKCYGVRGQGNLVKAGRYKKDGTDRQMLKCKVCGHRFSETRNTIFFRSRYSDQTIQSIIRCVVEGNGVRATARMLGLSKDGVNSVILTAGAYAEAVMSDLLKNLHLNECQMDELWSFVNKKKRWTKRS